MITNNLFNKIEGLKIDLGSISAYNYESATIQELISILVQKMNELLENVKNFEGDTEKIVNEIKGDQLLVVVTNRINELIEDGTITNIIGDKLINQIKTDITNLKDGLLNGLNSLNDKINTDKDYFKDLLNQLIQDMKDADNSLKATIDNNRTDIDTVTDMVENRSEMFNTINETLAENSDRISGIENNLNNVSNIINSREMVRIGNDSNTDPIWIKRENLIVFEVDWTVEVTKIIPEAGTGSSLFMLKMPTENNASVVLHHRATPPGGNDFQTEYTINTPDHGDMYLEDYTAYEFLCTPYGWILTNELKTLDLNPDDMPTPEPPTNPNMFSKEGLYFVKGFEGYAKYKYPDPLGKTTVGYGTTYGEAMSEVPLSEERATWWLVKQTKEIYYKELKALFDKNGIKLQNSRQWDAMISFTYNLGVGNVQKATFFKLMKEGDYGQSEAFWNSWEAHNKGTINGVLTPLEGLKRRRADEKAIWTNSRPVKNYDKSLTPSIPLVNSSGAVYGTLTENNGWGCEPQI